MKPSELIRERGWIQGRPGNRIMGYCIVGAIWYVYTDKETRFQIYRRLSENRLMPIAIWNDMQGRTQNEVVTLLESIGE